MDGRQLFPYPITEELPVTDQALTTNGKGSDHARPSLRFRALAPLTSARGVKETQLPGFSQRSVGSDRGKPYREEQGLFEGS